jgi:Thioredoxin
MLRGKKLFIAVFSAVMVLALIYLIWRDWRKREGFATGDAAQVTVTYYYMKGCPWCNKFSGENQSGGEWQAFKELVQKQKLPVVTQAVDGEQHSDQVTSKGIHGFPTLVITDAKGADTIYDGERTAPAILAAVKKYL